MKPSTVKTRRREVFPAIFYAGLLGHIFVSVPLLLYVLSTIDGRIVFYFLLFSFQLYVCTLVCLALFSRDEVIPPLIIRFLRLFSIFCWGGICFMIYTLVGSIVFARTQREPTHPKTSPARTLARPAECCSSSSLALEEGQGSGQGSEFFCASAYIRDNFGADISL